MPSPNPARLLQPCLICKLPLIEHTPESARKCLITLEGKYRHYDPSEEEVKGDD